MKAFQPMNPSPLYFEIGQSSLQALDGEDGFEIPLERRENGRLSATCREKLITGLRDFLQKRSRPSRPQAFCAIGARGVSMRRLTLPASSREELQRLLLLQIESEFPLPPDELAWGYRPLSPELASRNGAVSVQEVLVVAVKKEVLEEYAEILSGCGLDPVFTLGVLARGALCPRPYGSFALLHLGRSESELVSFDNAVPSSIHILPWGDDTIARVSQTAPIADSESAELTALAQSLQPKWVGQRLYVAGSHDHLDDLASRLAQAMGSGVLVERLETVSGPGRSAAILGLKKACEPGAETSPLVLQFSPSRNGEVVARPPWKSAAVAGLLLLGLGFLRYAEAFFQTPRLVQRVTEIEAYRDRLPKVERELNFLQYLKTNQPPYLDTVATLANAAPAGVRIDSLAMSRRGDLSVRATMRDSQQVVDLRSKLIDSGFFSTVVVEEQTPTPDRQKMIVRFSAQLKPASERKALPSDLSPARSPGAKAPANEARSASAGSSVITPPAAGATATPPKAAKE